MKIYRKCLVIGLMILFLGASAVSSNNTISNTCDITYEKDYGSSFDDISAYRYQTMLYSISEGIDGNSYCGTLQGTGQANEPSG